MTTPPSNDEVAQRAERYALPPGARRALGARAAVSLTHPRSIRHVGIILTSRTVARSRTFRPVRRSRVLTEPNELDLIWARLRPVFIKLLFAREPDTRGTREDGSGASS